ncbi:hypothetical protein CBW65_01990 [Tumebacillus avium]|uniref:HNH endonuclease 5 domain-containing protein n=1 Tax=Tumebacillus avium TaxID=1903704 RepID=A0A1Y0IHQ0_9BACL|nr:hypothetical protein [Tumebacillus avium]ARU59967.1 hypothetical protein CBW65_01990 [Tumebacillus avium]
MTEKALVKQLCICCGESGKATNKEHVFPQWILKKTNTFNNPISGLFSDKKLPGKNCVIPICIECNSELGLNLEAPASQIFERIESGAGFNDHEAEILVRWLWKITGMFYWINHSTDKDQYGFISLKNKVLKPIESPRDRITLAITLTEDEFEEDVDSPMGIDVLPRLSNVLAAGVFSKTAIIVTNTDFAGSIPDNYTKYTLSSVPMMMSPNYKIHPKVGFQTGTEAVGITITTAMSLLHPHEMYAANEWLSFIRLTREDSTFLPNEFKDYTRRVMMKDRN